MDSLPKSQQQLGYVALAKEIGCDLMKKLILSSGDAIAWGTPIKNLQSISKTLGRIH